MSSPAAARPAAASWEYPPSADRVIVQAAARTHQGSVRANNEDAVGSVQPTDPTERDRKGLLFAVADGLGGLNAGEVASAAAIKILLDEYYAPSNHGRIEPALRHAVQLANLRVHDLGQKHVEHRGMATTLTALALAGTTAYVAHVGDTRIYRLREKTLSQLTSDHSEVADLIRMRIVKPELAATHPSRNVLTRTIGQHLMIRPDFAREPTLPEDVFIMCSDGVWSEVQEPELAEVAATAETEDACRQITDLCLERQCDDNVTVLVVRVLEIDQAAQHTHHRPTLLGTIFDRLR
jgi:PPM family protein phosphatase